MAEDREVLLQLDAIERHLASLEATVRLMVAARLVEDGHAPDWKVAIAWARDPERLRQLYPEAVS
jgi:hypothetical protein